MSYQPWNQQQFQPVGAGPVLIQPWQRELGCTALRPRSFSLGSRPAMNSSSDLFEVSSKRPNNPAPTILPLDTNYNSNKRRNASGQSKYKCAGRSLLVLLILAGSLVATLGWWRLSRYNASSPMPESRPIPELATPSHQQQQQQQQQPQQHSAYHPLPPPPPALVPPGWQGQPQPHQPQQQPQQQPQHYYQHQQQQQQQHQQQYYQPEPQQLPYNQPHYQYGQQQMYHQQVQQPQPSYVQQQQYYPQNSYKPQQQQYSYSQPPVSGHHPEMMHHQGEPAARKPWMLEHMDVPVVNPPQQQQQQQQYYQPPPPPVEPVVVEPEMTRQEERAQARKDARTMNPTKAPKISDSDNIWETETSEVNADLESNNTVVEELPELQLDSVENSFSESVESSDGETVFLTSFEDVEDVTIETVMD